MNAWSKESKRSKKTKGGTLPLFIKAQRPKQCQINGLQKMDP